MTRVRRHRPRLTPHDALFRHVFGDPARAAEMVRCFLPRRVTRPIDWASLRPVPRSFVDEALANRRADLVFTVRVAGHPTLLFLLIEHKSAPDRMTVFQVARYAMRLQERWLAEHPRARFLPAVLPFVLFHGPRRWRGPRRLRELVGLPPALRSWRGSAPDFTFELVDLNALGPRLERGSMAVASKLPLLHLQQVGGRLPTSLLLRRWTRQYRTVFETPGGLPIVDRLVSYVATVSRDDHRDLKAAYQDIDTTIGRTYMTVADRLIREGRREGKREGKREGRREGEREGRRRVLHLQLESRFGTLSTKALARLAKATVDELDRWARAVLAAKTLDEVLV